MNLQKEKNIDHRQQFKQEIAKAKETSQDAFFTWFDGGKNADACFVKGAWDFANYIAPYLFLYIHEPEQKNILEIGYGGGRVLSAAAKYFNNAVGIDIHECQDTVLRELKKRGISNVSLHTADGEKIPLSNGSIDVVYSFIVFQHVERIDIFKSYVCEISRVLKPGGIAVIYFGRYCRFSLNQKSKILWLVDNMLEKIIVNKGYEEKKVPVNCINLIVSRGYAKKLCKEAGLSVLDEMTSYKPDGHGNKIFGLQNGLVLVKNL